MIETMATKGILMLPFVIDSFVFVVHARPQRKENFVVVMIAALRLADGVIRIESMNVYSSCCCGGFKAGVRPRGNSAVKVMMRAALSRFV